MIKVSTTGMSVSLITDLRFPTPGQQGHGRRIIQMILTVIYQMLSTGEAWNPTALYKIDMPEPLRKAKGKGYQTTDQRGNHF